MPDLEEGEDGRRYKAPALEKGLDILELLATTSTPMTLTQIVNQLDRSHGELFRMVQVLEFRGYIEQEGPSEGYVLTDKLFSLEEVECIGACCWAPAMQVNYDFHEDLTPAKVDQILDDYAAGRGKDVK